MRRSSKWNLGRLWVVGGCSCDNDRALNGPDDPCVDVAHDPLKAIADDPGNIIIGAGNTGDGI